MVRTSPSSLRRAYLSTWLVGEAALTVVAALMVMLVGVITAARGTRSTVRTRPRSIRQGHSYEAVLGEVVLGVLLVSALAISPHDAVPVDSADDSIGPNVRLAASLVQ